MTSHSAQIDRREQPSTVRNLKLLVLVLVLSNIGLGMFSFFLLRATDDRYTDLIERSVPLLNDLQTLTAKSVEVMRVTNPTFFESGAEKRQAAATRGRAVLEAERGLRAKIATEERLVALGERSEEFRRSGEAFTKLGGEVLALFSTGKSAEALKLRDEAMRPAFERYLEATTRAADMVEERSTRTNEDYSTRTGNAAKLVLGIASWPVIAVIALLVFTALFLAVLMLAFRGKDLSEAP